jgi:hypothetical protein
MVDTRVAESLTERSSDATSRESILLSGMDSSRRQPGACWHDQRHRASAQLAGRRSRMSPPRAFLLDMVALFVLGAIGIVMALGIRQIEMRLLRWRPEYQKR